LLRGGFPATPEHPDACLVGLAYGSASKEVVMDNPISRRSVLVGGSLLAAAVALGVDVTACSKSTGPYRVLTDHEAEVVREATARLIPGPTDDPTEAGHPGAREANVVRYIDGMLGAFHFDPPLVYAGGPFSDRGGAKHDDMADFVDLPPVIRDHWKQKLDELTKQYQDGVKALDAAAGGDFAKATVAQRDAALVKNPKGFRELLFQHAIEGCYAVPEYHGNESLVMWKDIKFPGDSQPRGHTPDEVSRSDGPDPLVRDGVVDKVLSLLEATSPASGSKVPITRPS
jgi:hypothetical protein